MKKALKKFDKAFGKIDKKSMKTFYKLKVSFDKFAETGDIKFDTKLKRLANTLGLIRKCKREFSEAIEAFDKLKISDSFFSDIQKKLYEAKTLAMERCAQMIEAMNIALDMFESQRYERIEEYQKRIEEGDKTIITAVALIMEVKIGLGVIKVKNKDI